MKKRILSCFLALAMALSLLPMSVLAVGGDETPIRDSFVTNAKNNITVNKTVSGDQKDGYTVTMEAYAENQVTSSTTTKPLDIVLVLDVSGSMDDPMQFDPTISTNWSYNSIYYSDTTYYYKDKESGGYFEVFADSNYRGYYLYYTKSNEQVRIGNYARGSNGTIYSGQLYTGGKETRIEALKPAVTQFIQNVAANATENSVEHQISIVKFAGTSSEYIGDDTYNDWGNRYNNSQIVKGLTSVQGSGETELINAVNDLDPAGATRADYGMQHARRVLNAVDEERDSQKVVVMFTDGDPTSSQGFEDEVANGAISASKDLKDQGVLVYTIGIFGGANPDDLNTSNNQYMNGVSSNYPNATSYTKLGERVSAGLKYYFASDSAAGLAGVFEIISNTITSSSLTANPDEAAVLSDTLSEYFDFPADVMNDGKITVQKVPVTGKNPDGSYTWGSGENITSEVTIQTVSDTLTVKGFDYKQNAVTEQGGTYSGAKLVVSFPIVPDEDACILKATPDNYYPTNSVAGGRQAGLSYKEDDKATSNNASTLLSSSPKVHLDRTNFNANGTDVTVQVFLDGEKVDNPLDYVTLTRDVRDTSYNYFQQVGEVKDGVLTYDFNYNPGDGGHDCVDIQVDIKEDATYLLQGVTSYQSYGNAGTDNVRTNTTGEEIPDVTYTVDNVTADDTDAVDCTIYLYTKYSVEYYQDSEKLTTEDYTDANVYIAEESVDASTEENAYPTADNSTWMDWKNDTGLASINLPALPTADTGYTSDGWFLGSVDGERQNSPVAVSKVTDPTGRVIQFYATSNVNQYTITINYVDGEDQDLKDAYSDTQNYGYEYSFDVSSDDTGNIPFIIDKEGTQYVFNCFTDGGDKLNGTLKENLVITAQYLPDTNGNEIPDAYEATVTYKVVNGTWIDDTATDKTADFTLRVFNDETNSWDELYPKLGDTIPTGMKPNPGYASEGLWSDTIDATTPAVNDAIYTYTFADRVYTLTYDANGGNPDSVPTDTTPYKSGNTATLDTKTVPTHDKAGDTSVIFIGWSETKSDTIFSAGEDYGDTVKSVSFTDKNITVYAVWGYDTNGDDIADATQVLIQPADITIYTGGTGYTGVVTGEDGNIVGSTSAQGMPEPGYYITLPYAANAQIQDYFKDEISTDESGYVNLSNILSFSYDVGDETRNWSLELYSTTGNSEGNSGAFQNDRYIYRLVSPDGQLPVRLQFAEYNADGTIDSDSYVSTDEFIVDFTTLYKEYAMGIYPGALDQKLVMATIKLGDEVSSDSNIGILPGNLTIRGTTNSAVTETVGSDTSKSGFAATVSDGTTYTINGSDIKVDDPSKISLLVDDIVTDNTETSAEVVQALKTNSLTALTENGVSLTNPTYAMKYLDLVDAGNGNVYVTASNATTITWPIPEGANANGTFYVIHFKDLNRDFSGSETVNKINAAETEVLEATVVDDTIQFTVNSFSPFVLAYDNAAPGLSVDKSIETVNGRDYTGGRVSVGDTIGYSIVVKNTGNTTLTNVTVTDTLWTAGQTITVNGSTDSVNDDGSYVIETLAPDASVTITYTYKVVRSDGGKTLSNTAVAKDGSGTTGEDTEEVVVKRPSSGGDVEPPELDTENHYGYIVGYDDGTVRPNGKITRAEVATIFFRLLTDESRDAYWCQTNDFSDVSASDWFNNAISTLTNAGILDGYEDGTFRPNGNITRAEFATIAVRFFDLTYEGEDLFPDISDHWARDYINQAAAAGFVNGYEDGTFRPNNAITRAEAVTLVNRTLERKPHKAHLLADMIQWPDNMDQTTWYYADIQEATNSHEYYMTTSEQGEEYEIWTELLPMRDWPALEKEWSDANSSTGADVTR